MTAASDAIAALDRQLAAKGQGLTWRRYAGLGLARSATDATVRGSVRDYQPREILGGIAAGDTRVILSPTDVGPVGRGWPEIGDFVVIDGRERRVKAAPVTRMNDQVVRIDLQVEG